MSDRKSVKNGKTAVPVERKVWVIMQRSYEYNDETYDMQDGGNVVIAYSDYNKALEALEQKMIDSVRRGECHVYYGWEPSSYFSDSHEFSEMLERLGYSYEGLGDWSDFNEIVEKIEDASEEDIKLFIEHLNEPLYYLETVTLA